MKKTGKILLSILIILILILIYPNNIGVKAEGINPPTDCISVLESSCPKWKPFNCPGTLFCCPDASYCTEVTPYITEDPKRGCDMCGCDLKLDPPATSKKCPNCDSQCEDCFQQDKVWTALGCIPADPEKLIKMFFPYLLGIGGTIAFGLIVFGGIQVMTSSGDPEKIKGGKELITSALTGLVFIILSLFLLKLIGVDILTLPGLE